MANPPKQKGTGYETEVLRALDIPGLVRTPPTTKWDLEKPGESPLEVLATRPDRGQSLVTLRLVDFIGLWDAYHKVHSTKIMMDGDNRVVYDQGPGLRVECKRYARFALHSIFTEKFST